MFLLVQEAYDTLGDEEMRGLYDGKVAGGEGEEDDATEGEPEHEEAREAASGLAASGLPSCLPMEGAGEATAGARVSARAGACLESCWDHVGSCLDLDHFRISLGSPWTI